MDREFWDDAYKEDADSLIVVDRILDTEVEGLTPGRALDLGCGTGLNALMLAQRGWSVLGVDWVEHAIELATDVASSRGLDAQFVVADITSWQPPEMFDLVILTYALPGGEESRRALQTAVSALAAGGTLIVAEWDQSMAEGWGFDLDELPTPEEIVDMLPEMDIEVAEVRTFPDMFDSTDDFRGQHGPGANVAFVRARKPLSDRG
jgi:SAM-dependent methyltransferase